MKTFFCIKLELLRQIYGLKGEISFIDKNGAPIGTGPQKFPLFKRQKNVIRHQIKATWTDL